MPKSPALTGTAGTLPLPNTTPTPAVGENVTAASIQSAVEPLLDQDATLEATKASLAGAAFTGPVSVIGGVSVSGGIELTGSQPSPTADPGGNNRVYGANVAKAWATMVIGGGSASATDAYNVASVSISTNEIIVTFARAMANDDYAVTWGVENDAAALAYPVINSTKTTAGFHFNLWSISGGGTLINPATASSRKVSFAAHARQ